MLTKEQKLKIAMINRANWLRKHGLGILNYNIATGEYEEEPKGYSDIKEIKDLQEVRDKLLMQYDIDLAMKVQVKINELLGKEERI